MPEPDTEFECNRVMWFTSLPEEERGPFRRIEEDITSWANSMSLDVRHYHIRSSTHLIQCLSDLENECRKKAIKPIIHFDMHGDAKRGLYVPDTLEYVSWELVVSHFKKINVEAKNNLVVVLASCYAFNLISQIRLKDPAPFFVLLAPSKAVEVGYLEDNMKKFYVTLFESGSIHDAHSNYLSEQFQYLHCEKLLFSAIAEYIKVSCIGKPARERRERLLTEMINNGLPKTPQNLKMARQKIKNGLRPDKTLLNKYVSTFLIGKPCSFTIEAFNERFNLTK